MQNYIIFILVAKTLRSNPLLAQQLSGFSSAADNKKDCAFNEESMALLPVLVHTTSFNFRCGGKLDLTCEDRERSMTLIQKTTFFRQKLPTMGLRITQYHITN